MKTPARRIAINFGGGYVPGLNAVIHGAALSARQLGWELAGLRDGYDGLLFPERYPDGGLLTITPPVVEDLAGGTGCMLGTAAQSDPFHVRTVREGSLIEEVDRSDELLERLRSAGIDAVISVVGARAFSILWKLHRKGLRTVCVPKSAENDVAATALSFGFNSVLGFVAEMLERSRQAARSARRVGVVEVPGENAGWLALQAGMAVCADAVLIPEIPYDLRKVAAVLRERAAAGATSGLVVVAEGARSLQSLNAAATAPGDALRSSLSPGATGSDGFGAIARSGRVAAEVALELQRQTDRETYPLALGQLARGGAPTVVDRQLGLGCGAAAVRALRDGQSGVMVAFQPPDLKLVPMAEALNQVRTVPVNSEFVQIARALGIALGD